MVNSLLTAIVRADGDALVMHVGEQPYVVAASGPVELSSRPLTLEAVAGMLGQLLPSDSRRALREPGAIQYELPQSLAGSDERFTVVAARGGDDISIEIRRHRSPAAAALPLRKRRPTPLQNPWPSQSLHWLTRRPRAGARPAPISVAPEAAEEIGVPMDLPVFQDAPAEPSATVEEAPAPAPPSRGPTANARRSGTARGAAAGTFRRAGSSPQERFVAPRPTAVDRPDRFEHLEPVSPVLPSPALERFAAVRSSRPAEPAAPPPQPMSEAQDQSPPQAEQNQAVVLPLARNPVRPDNPQRPSPPPRIAGLDRLFSATARRARTIS